MKWTHIRSLRMLALQGFSSAQSRMFIYFECITLFVVTSKTSSSHYES